jgi:hypothetical protein
MLNEDMLYTKSIAGIGICAAPKNILELLAKEMAARVEKTLAATPKHKKTFSLI